MVCFNSQSHSCSVYYFYYLDLTYQFSDITPTNFLLNNLREFDDSSRQHPSLDMRVDFRHLFPR